MQGGEEQGGMRFFAPSKMQSAKDMPAHTQLKYRQDGQFSAAELKQKNLRAELEEKERNHYLKSKSANFDEEKEEDLRLLEGATAGGGAGPSVLIPKAIDADDEDDEEESDSSDDDDDEDEEAELLAELERIKRERAEEAARKAAAATSAAEAEQRDELLRGNPLLQDKLGAGGSDSFAIKRRWDDDVVFKNQARGEPKQQRRFINDTIRSDFHRRFLDRYIK